jgi:hypothetical protein
MSGSEKTSQSDYSRLDRLLHHLAFGSPGLQRILADLENDIYRKKIESARKGGEVFVTGLPRSGTTLLLNLLYETGEFATFTYRQMPFLQIPLLWSRMSSPFQLTATEQERAHGDQMKVSFDSPEAFEEAIWLAYMRDQIEAPHHLLPVGSKDYAPEFAAALRKTIAKVTLLHSQGQPESAARQLRYLSKNNANVSRLDALRRLFPQAVILVPFREPAAHVASLMQQHKRFLAQHQEDAFSRHYMRWLGHFEFGANLKPINFGNWLEGREPEPAGVDENFWLEYWIHAYRYVLEKRSSGAVLVDFDALLRNGGSALEAIASKVQLIAPSAFIAASDTLRAPTTQAVQRSRFSPGLWGEAEGLYHELVAAALQPGAGRP